MIENSDQQDLLNPDELHVVKYGTFWPRFWALLLDGLILSILAPLVYYNKYNWKSSTLLIAITLVQLGYKSFFEFMYGATPGKMALKLKVVNYDYQKPSLENILLRNIFQLIAGIFTLGISLYSLNDPVLAAPSLNNNSGALIVLNVSVLAVYIADLIVLLNNDESRSLHDLIGRTYVVKL